MHLRRLAASPTGECVYCWHETAQQTQEWLSNTALVDLWTQEGLSSLFRTEPLALLNFLLLLATYTWQELPYGMRLLHLSFLLLAGPHRQCIFCAMLGLTKKRVTIVVAAGVQALFSICQRDWHF